MSYLSKRIDDLIARPEVGAVPADDPAPVGRRHVHPGPIDEPDGEHGDMPALIEAHNAAAARGDGRGAKAAYMEIVRASSRRGGAR